MILKETNKFIAINHYIVLPVVIHEHILYYAVTI